MRIEEFAENTSDELDRGARRPGARRACRALVIDLRNNPGGLLDSAVDVAGKFVPPNTVIVSTKGRTADESQDFRARAQAQHPDYPIALLINGYSASGAEIVAGALKDLQPRDPRGRDDVRQRLRADGAAARQRRGPAPDHGEVLYAEQKDDPRGRRRARHRRADHRRGAPHPGSADAAMNANQTSRDARENCIRSLSMWDGAARHGARWRSARAEPEAGSWLSKRPS